MNSSAPSIENVSDTAIWVATFRAEESQRADRLFNDPFAEALSGERGKTLVKTMGHENPVRFGVVLRTALIDRMILNLIDDGVDLVLNLGAGLDSRPFRMNLPSDLRWIEVDFPELMAYKAEIMKGAVPRCHLRQISINLADTEARQKMLADVGRSGRKILVLTEGVITYLSNEEAGQLASELRDVPSIRFWIQNYLSWLALTYLRQARRSTFHRAPLKFTPHGWFNFFVAYGWRVKEKRMYSSLARQIACRSQSSRWPAPILWLRHVAGKSNGCVIFEK